MSGSKRPNILLTFADDQSAYAMGCAGNETLETPAMDDLAPDPSQSERIAALRHHLFDYLRRHGDPCLDAFAC